MVINDLGSARCAAGIAAMSKGFECAENAQRVSLQGRTEGRLPGSPPVCGRGIRPPSGRIADAEGQRTYRGRTIRWLEDSPSEVRPYNDCIFDAVLRKRDCPSK